MDDVITLSSDDSDVEIVDSFKTEPLPLASVRIDVDAVKVNVPPHFIDLTDPRWTLPELKRCKRQNSTALTVVDLTEHNIANGTQQETENLLLGDCKIKKESSNKDQTSDKQDVNLQESSSRESAVLAQQHACGNLTPKWRRLNSQTQHQMLDSKEHSCHHTPSVELRRLPFLETHVRELKTSSCSVYFTKDCAQMSLSFTQMDINNDAPECMSNLRTPTSPHGPCMEPSLDESPPKVTEYLIGQEQQEDNNEFTSTQLDDFCGHSSPHSPTTRLNPSELFDLDSMLHRSPLSHNLQSHADPTPTSEHTPAENTSEWQSDEAMAERGSHSLDFLHCNIPSEPQFSVPKTEDMDKGSETGSYRGDVGIDSPVSFHWQEGSDGEEVNQESRFDKEFRAASREDRHFVCPVTLRKIMSGPGQALIDLEDEGLGTPEVLCRQSLSLVYSTIDENYPEGTLQLLSDLLQPGFYPPRDITTHLLRSILLDPQCPSHLCVQAFNLLMRTQRHHMADKTTVAWDWELLTSVVDGIKRHQCEVVRMLLEYVVQTLEDDFQAKRSVSALHQSVAKATLSCDQQFSQVKDVIKWLFSAIMKSTEHGDSRKTTRERDEQIRMVSIFQRMLSLALEVDRSPALSSAKLSQELFHMLISNMPLRAHRMLLLESLQSNLLRCKLLEHLLDYACPQKISVPMSLSLLLHFMKNCTLAPDPMDGTERWQRWEELVHLLWMLLLSYNKAMKGYLCSSVTEQRGRVGALVYKPDDKVSKPAIREAVEAFLSRSQADLGQTLPLHVEESLTYLQDHLVAVCQC